MNLKDRLKELRKSLGLTQKEFAEKLGVVRNNIAGYETGTRNPSDAVLSLICKQNWNGEFVNPDWLRTGSGDMFVKMDREDQLMAWAGEVLRDDSESYRKRFLAMLMELNEDEMETLLKVAIALHEDKNK